jgi:actin-related protein
LFASACDPAVELGGSRFEGVVGEDLDWARVHVHDVRGARMVRDIKEEFAYDCEQELQKVETWSESDAWYTLREGNVMTIGGQRLGCAGLWFKPRLSGFEDDGIGKALFDSIMKFDIDVRKDLYAKIVLWGGTRVFQGLPERLEKESVALSATTMKVKVVAPWGRKYGVWIGRWMLSRLATFLQMVRRKRGTTRQVQG